jgi:hypothetical protein
MGATDPWTRCGCLGRGRTNACLELLASRNGQKSDKHVLCVARVSMRQEQDRKADTQGHCIEVATICGFLGRRMVREENEGRDPKGQQAGNWAWLRADSAAVINPHFNARIPVTLSRPRIFLPLILISSHNLSMFPPLLPFSVT